MASKKVRQVGRFVETTAVLHGRPSDRFIGTDWDRQPGDGQHLDKLKERVAMGRKMTPPGDVKLRKA